MCISILKVQKENIIKHNSQHDGVEEREDEAARDAQTAVILALTRVSLPAAVATAPAAAEAAAHDGHDDDEDQAHDDADAVADVVECILEQGERRLWDRGVSVVSVDATLNIKVHGLHKGAYIDK